MGNAVSRADASRASAVFAGGALGALARVAVERLCAPADGGWPWAVFLVNLSGAFALGYLAARRRRATRGAGGSRLQAFAESGICGAYTTFATFQLELFELLRSGRLPLAFSYIAATVAGGYLLLRAADRLAQHLHARERIPA